MQAKSRALGGPAIAGSALTMPARSLYTGQVAPNYAPRSDAFPHANPEVLEKAREEARRIENEGLEQMRKTGKIPQGPPSIPTGVVVVEQKYVDFLVGPGGQSLAAVNYAAGVNVLLDQSNKCSGYSVANIYGPEQNVKNAKIAIDFKVSQWLPLPGRGGLGSNGPRLAPVGR